MRPPPRWSLVLLPSECQSWLPQESVFDWFAVLKRKWRQTDPDWSSCPWSPHRWWLVSPRASRLIWPADLQEASRPPGGAVATDPGLPRQADTWPVLPDLREGCCTKDWLLTTVFHYWRRQQAVLYPQCWETWWRNSWCLFKKPLKGCYGNGTKEDLTLARLSRFLLFWGLYRDSCCLNTNKNPNVIKPNRTVLIQSYIRLIN